MNFLRFDFYFEVENCLVYAACEIYIEVSDSESQVFAILFFQRIICEGCFFKHFNESVREKYAYML